MGDFLTLCLVIALSCAKLILIAILIVAIWVWIKNNSPETAESIKKMVPDYNKESE